MTSYVTVRFLAALLTITVFFNIEITTATVDMKFDPNLKLNTYIFPRFRKSKDWVEDENCGVHKVEQIHLVMDRVCEMCHEMFSHEMNSLRAQCRSNCFDNNLFRNCLKLFSETKKSASPSERRIPDEPIMTLANF
ncbi:unnamed protein product [Auanema sp. JU1783]|nr:unnamed protein product [Auanema sp. JU1783]